MKTLQEWANFTDWYVAQDKNGKVFAYKGEPYIGGDSFRNQCLEGNIYKNYIEISEMLVIPFEYDWKDSLTVPQGDK